MQFITNGPDIPDALLRAHEEGRVVFFCGAGISYPAKLPGFKGLVDEIYQRVGTTRNDIENEAYERNQYDATLDLLERRIPGQRIAIRKALAASLQPKLRGKGAIDTHAALLQLARSREGALRIVTTNFDRIFDYVSKRKKQPINSYLAPMLPIPKSSRWNGVVYLHGQLPEGVSDSALHRLVVTSGDFGLAYLTERWAARFVSELFRNYIVCFVGYSINDSVLRYMMDALAADRMLGEVTPQAYALGDCVPGQERKKTNEWEAKGVAPILYHSAAGSNDHSALHNTLKVWAETYRDGVLGKERIIVDYALARPSGSTAQDNFVGRLIWALSHESGLPAKRFAEFNPVPSLEWLEAFSEDRYQHDDLAHFAVPPSSKADDKLRFSLVRRPAPYHRAPWMALVTGGGAYSQWDDVMFQLARWLLRHLNDPAMIIWLSNRGGELHDRWSWLIEHELENFARLEREGKTKELDDIRSNAPNAIPTPWMRTLWRLLLTGRVKSPSHDVDLYRWKDRLRRDGLTATLRIELRDLLAPKVVLKKPFRWTESESEEETPKKPKQLVDWELVLAANHAHSSVGDLKDNEQWNRSLVRLLEDFQLLLTDALDLFRELGEADDCNDRSHWDMPSISDHWQNRGFREWVTLIELLRDAWLATRVVDPDRARRVAQNWFLQPYSTYKRLALFAASHDHLIDAEQWVKWLLDYNSWWLWSVDTQREAMRLLVLQGARLSVETRQKLEGAILVGPPRAMYRDGIEPKRWQSLVEHSVWLHLAKLREAGPALGAEASAKFEELSAANPEWQLQKNESDEFSHWMSGTGDPDYENKRDVEIAPTKRADLVRWLQRPVPTRRPLYEDTWRQVCQKHFLNAGCALADLAREGKWPASRWREALQAWSEKRRVLRSWKYFAPLVLTMPDEIFKEIASALTWWFEEVSKADPQHVEILLVLCRRVLALPDDGEADTDQPVTAAINHPIGHVAQALLHLWLKRKPNDNDLLPADIAPILTELCDATVERYRHGRVLLASRLIALFRVDRAWTEANLLPVFDWDVNAAEAKAAWEGFLWSPRLYAPLLVAYKRQFLATAHHYGDLGEHGRPYAAILTYAALDPVDGFSNEDYRAAISAMPPEGLDESAQALSQALEGAGGQAEDYWKNRIHPFWMNIWPKSRDLTSARVSESLIRMSLAARGEFPAALTAVFDWLLPVEHPHYLVHLLEQSGLTARFPADVLRLLNAMIDDQSWPPRELGHCLDAIVRASPPLLQDHRHVRLVEYVRRRGN